VPFRPLRAVGAGLRPAPTHEGYSIEVRSDNMGGDCYPAPPLAVKLRWLVAYPPPPLALRAISPSRGQRVVLRVPVLCHSQPIRPVGPFPPQRGKGLFSV